MENVKFSYLKGFRDFKVLIMIVKGPLKRFLLSGRFSFLIYGFYSSKTAGFRWPRVLRRRSAAARLLRLWVRIPPAAYMSAVSVFR